MGARRRCPVGVVVSALGCVLSALRHSTSVPYFECRPLVGFATLPAYVGHWIRRPPPARAMAKVGVKAFDGASASASALTRMIKQARTPDDLWAVAAAPGCDLVHRATILFDLAEMARQSRDFKFAIGSEGATSLRELLTSIINDLRYWKASGNLKPTRRGKADVVAEQAQYLGNLIWALGMLKAIISETLPASEYTILFESAVLAALEGIPDFMGGGRTKEILQILFGLRGVGRTLQSDALYSAIAPGLLQFIQKHGTERDKDLGHSLLSFGSYGLQDEGITQFFVDAKKVLMNKARVLNAQNLVQAVKGYALYAHRCVHHTPDPTNFAVSLVKEDRQKLGITMQSEPGKPGLVVSKITEGLVKRWNRYHPEWNVVEGDRILNANGVNGSAANISKEILGKSAITMVLQRGRVAVRVSDRHASDGVVPAGVRDEELMQLLGQRLAPLIDREDNVYDRIKFTTNAVMSYIMLGIYCEPVFRMASSSVLKHSQFYVSSYTCELLWGLGKLDVGYTNLVKVLIRRASALLAKDQIHLEEMPVLYHALKKFGYTGASSEIQLLLDVASCHGITVNYLEAADGTPRSWM